MSCKLYGAKPAIHRGFRRFFKKRGMKPPKVLREMIEDIVAFYAWSESSCCQPQTFIEMCRGFKHSKRGKQ